MMPKSILYAVTSMTAMVASLTYGVLGSQENDAIGSIVGANRFHGFSHIGGFLGPEFGRSFGDEDYRHAIPNSFTERSLQKRVAYRGLLRKKMSPGIASCSHATASSDVDATYSGNVRLSQMERVQQTVPSNSQLKRWQILEKMDMNPKIKSFQCFDWGMKSKRGFVGDALSSILDLPRSGGAEEDEVEGNAESGKKKLVLIIDVDNTLYSEKDFICDNRGNDDINHVWHGGIESQIIRNTHLFGLKYFNLTSQECDDLYKMYGSTVEGLRHILLQNASGPNSNREKKVAEMLGKFYNEVYDPIDFSCLLNIDGEMGSSRSGYDHGQALQKRRDLSQFLKSLCETHTVYLASNSPKNHVLRVLNGMGLRDINFSGVLSPDVTDRNTLPVSDHDAMTKISFPTKASPQQFYSSILDRHPVQTHRIVLLDDSLHNIQSAETVGMEGILVNKRSAQSSTTRTLEEGLAEALGHILPPEPSNSLQNKTSSFTFSDVKYLHAKNAVDINSIDPVVWEKLAQQLAIRLIQKQDGVLCIADLGAGMLSMLELLTAGGGEGDRAKPSILDLIASHLEKESRSEDGAENSLKSLEYYAYESNANLLDVCRERLHRLGFKEISSKESNLQETGISFRRKFSSLPFLKSIDVTIHLCPVDFQQASSPLQPIDLIIGCCFADLFDPDDLTLALLRFAKMSEREGKLEGDNKMSAPQYPPLVYFPITFAGNTQFCPSYPSASSENASHQRIPSDTAAFQLYANSLSSHGHNLDPSLITQAVRAHGGSLIARGTSNWVIDPKINEFLWDTMMYFFGMSGAREIAKQHLDAAGWIQRSRLNRRPIVASNVDLLFRLGIDEVSEGENDFNVVGDNPHANPSNVSVQEIQFIAPYNVTSITKHWNTTILSHLAPNQVEIESLCSLISSGTELKIFKGSFESAALDVNIKGMSDESMEYPLAYGYSLVGKVVACGSNVADAESLIGKLVFTFSPHSTRVIADRDAIQLVPEGIDAEDAVFMPSVETALSLVHDAHVRIGENVAVYGQGLIGLLVTSILCMQTPLSISIKNPFCSVTAFDTLDDRLRLSSDLGATSALKPNFASTAGPFDVSIEVSGNPRGLQSAIDNTSNHGRIIVGSWYGNSDVSLKLGIDFHRSHKTIQTSQVSTIPPTLAGLWSKDRRFALTWALVKALAPSKLISKRVTLNEAQTAYELLDGGKEIAICFQYGEKK